MFILGFDLILMYYLFQIGPLGYERNTNMVFLVLIQWKLAYVWLLTDNLTVKSACLGPSWNQLLRLGTKLTNK